MGKMSGGFPVPFTKTDPAFSTLFPKTPKAPKPPPPPTEEAAGPIPELPDPEDELLQQRKRRAAAMRQQTGRASTLLSNDDRLGAG